MDIFDAHFIDDWLFFSQGFSLLIERLECVEIHLWRVDGIIQIDNQRSILYGYCSYEISIDSLISLLLYMGFSSALKPLYIVEFYLYLSGRCVRWFG